jgi:hypothetical protein
MAVRSADKKPEKYVGPDGKPKIRMVPVDRDVVKNEDASKEAQRHAQGIKDARADMKAATSADAMTKAMNKLQHHTKAHKKAKAAMSEAYNEPQGQAKRLMSPLQKIRMDKEKADRDSEGKLKPGAVKKEAKVDELSMTAIKKGITQGSGMKNVAKAMGKDKLKKDLEAMKARMATEQKVDEISMGKMQAYGKAAAKDIEKHRNTVKGALDQPASPKKAQAGLDAMKKLTKRSKGSDMYVDKMTGRSKVKPTAESKVDEVLDRPGALDSYRKKADASGNKARNSATRKILTAPKDGKRPDHSDELKTMRKRNKGQDMADRAANRHFRKSLGLGYNSKKESVEYVNEKLKVSDGMGAWVDDFKKSDAPQFKGKSDKERREMAIAAYLSAKRGAKEEGYVSYAQQKAVWANRKDGGKGHPDNKGKKK